ncbi:MAG: nicotinate-nucleotide adenylyltransferase [Agarilytica sp.]
MSKLPKVVLYGGSFDPVHLGHEHIVRTVNQQLTPQKIHIIPCHVPPHKARLHVENHHRLAMLRRAFDEGSTNLFVDTREMACQSVSYTVDTVTALRRELGEAVSISFVVGEDSWLNFSRWHRWQDILNKVNLVVVTRLGVWQTKTDSEDHKELQAYRAEHEVPLGVLDTYTHGQVAQLAMSPIDIASNTIRDCIAKGQSIDNMVSPPVASYIQEYGLYQKAVT